MYAILIENSKLRRVPWAEFCAASGSDTLGALQKAVGGLIEHISTTGEGGIDLYGNDEARLIFDAQRLDREPQLAEVMRWGPNVAYMPIGVLYGPLVVVASTPDGDTRALTEAEANRVALTMEGLFPIPFLTLDAITITVNVEPH